MGVGDFARKIENVDLINFNEVHPVARSGVNALVKDGGRITRNAIIHAVGCVRETIEKHLPANVGPAIPKQFEDGSRARRGWIKGG